MDLKSIEETRDADDSGLHFYYNREERLKNAPKIVKDYYDGKSPKPVKGLIRPLVATPANRLIFLTLVALTVFAWFYSRAAGDKTKASVNGMELSLSAFSYEEKVYAAVTCSPKLSSKKQSDPVPVAVKFILLSENNQIAATDAVKEIYSGSEINMRIKSADYDIITVRAEATVNGKTVTLTAAVKRQ